MKEAREAVDPSRVRSDAVRKKTPDGIEIDFDLVYRELFAPAVEDAGLAPHRADADRRGGSIHLDMFQALPLAELVVGDGGRSRTRTVMLSGHSRGSG